MNSEQQARARRNYVSNMFDTPFDWSDPMDENRVVDGLDLRVEFARNHGLSPQTMKRLGPGS